MPLRIINIGASANDGTGDDLRSSFGKCNENFSELYTKVITNKPSQRFLAGAVSGSPSEPFFRAIEPTDLPNNIPTSKLAGNDLVPTGAINMYINNTPPSGWLLCDGSPVSRTTYATLFGIIGTTYGVGDGSTTFNLPDFIGRVPVGRDVSGTRVSSDNDLGDSSGSETHTLTIAEMPSHTHTQSGGGGDDDGGARVPGSNSLGTQSNINPTGGDQPHNNMQPYLIVNYIIKT